MTSTKTDGLCRMQRHRQRHGQIDFLLCVALDNAQPLQVRLLILLRLAVRVQDVRPKRLIPVVSPPARQDHIVQVLVRLQTLPLLAELMAGDYAFLGKAESTAMSSARK